MKPQMNADVPISDFGLGRRKEELNHECHKLDELRESGEEMR